MSALLSAWSVLAVPLLTRPATPPRGDRGFGYDPIFVPEGETETFGEMDPAKKHAMSHRAVAFTKLKAFLSD